MSSSLSILSEKELLIKVADGDEKAFAELFYTHHNKLGAYVFGWTKSLQLAEEIVQDVFLKIWLNRELLRTVEKFDNYLYILSRNYTFNALRKIASEQLKRQEWARHFENDLEFDPDASGEDYLSIIEKAISNLPPQQQKVFILKRRQGLKYDEIASQLNIAPETARKHLAAAQRNIIAYIKSNPQVILLILSTPLVIK
jgi:RNA polymerase sigma-70 factor (ECF subfamily)